MICSPHGRCSAACSQRFRRWLRPHGRDPRPRRIRTTGSGRVMSTMGRTMSELGVTPRHSSAWPLLRRLILGAAVLGTLVAAFYIEENWRGRRAFAAFSRAAATAHISLNLLDQAPPAVPDRENFAKTPLLDRPLDRDMGPRYWQP